MKTKLSAKDFFPKKMTIPSLRAAAKQCHGCHLYKNATQPVFGIGNEHAKLIMVGEMPGNKEDQAGKPFVGPAGAFLHMYIQEIGMDLQNIYITNAVKHFKFKEINSRRKNLPPMLSEITACKPWLEAEINIIQPKVILCLGAVAAKAIINKNFQLKKQRGIWFTTFDAISTIATFHPSAILRAFNDELRKEMTNTFIKDLKKAAAKI